MKITYTESKNGIYYPNLTLPTGATYSIGKYGRLYLDYLKRHRRGTYTTLLTENRLNEHLHQVDVEASTMVLKTTDEITISVFCETLRIAIKGGKRCFPGCIHGIIRGCIFSFQHFGCVFWCETLR